MFSYGRRSPKTRTVSEPSLGGERRCGFAGRETALVGLAMVRGAVVEALRRCAACDLIHVKPRHGRSTPVIRISNRGRFGRALAVATIGYAVEHGACTHDGSAALARHALNARRRATRTGYLLCKAHPESPDKIDAVYATVG